MANPTENDLSRATSHPREISTPEVAMNIVPTGRRREPVQSDERSGGGAGFSSQFSCTDNLSSLNDAFSTRLTVTSSASHTAQAQGLAQSPGNSPQEHASGAVPQKSRLRRLCGERPPIHTHNHTPHIPSEHIPHVPSDQSPHITSTHTPNIPSEQTSHIPSDQTPCIPSNHTPNTHPGHTPHTHPYYAPHTHPDATSHTHPYYTPNTHLTSPPHTPHRPQTPPGHSHPSVADKLRAYAGYQAKILPNSTRTYLSNHLNIDIQALSESQVQKNWQGLAECMDMNVQYVLSLERRPDPTKELLRRWETEAGSTIGKLIEFLTIMDRYDILDDHFFISHIERSVKRHLKEMEQMEEEFKKQQQPPLDKPTFITTGDEAGKEEKFDAFVCYEPDEDEFVMEMLRELEVKRKHKLCLNARDLLVGQNEQSVTAALIKSRCDKTIVVLSSAFVRQESEMCQFALKVAQSLNPDSKSSKIIPVVAERCTPPTSLCHITPVDFARSSEREWQWRKVSACLQTTQEKLNVAEREALRGIALPSTRSRADLRASLRLSMAAESLTPSSSNKGVTIGILPNSPSPAAATSNSSPQKPTPKDKIKKAKRNYHLRNTTQMILSLFKAL